jgi:hypothetical protein
MIQSCTKEAMDSQIANNTAAGHDNLSISSRRRTWPKANREAIEKRRNLRKKRSRQSPLRQAKKAQPRDGSQRQDRAKNKMSRSLWRVVQGSDEFTARERKELSVGGDNGRQRITVGLESGLSSCVSQQIDNEMN